MGFINQLITGGHHPVVWLVITRPGKRTHSELERSTIFNGKIHYKSPFSIAMLNYQRVSHIIPTRWMGIPMVWYVHLLLVGYWTEEAAAPAGSAGWSATGGWTKMGRPLLPIVFCVSAAMKRRSWGRFFGMFLWQGGAKWSAKLVHIT